MRISPSSSLLLLGLGFLVATSACATAQNHSTLQQPTGTRLSATVGGSVFRIERTKDLPNAFGKADLFGGKVDAGYFELRFTGVEEDGRVRFRVTDLSTRSDETTMSRYGTTSARATSTTNGNVTTTDVTVNEPPRGSTTTLPPNTTEFLYDPRSGPLVLEGVEVTIVGLAPYRCDYSLRDQRAGQ